MEKDITRRVILAEKEHQPNQRAVKCLGNRHFLIILCVFLASFCLSEFLSIHLATNWIGLIGHGITLLSMLVFAGLSEDSQENQIYAVLSLTPLIRLVSLSLPLREIPLVYWYAATGMPIFFAALLMIRYADLNALNVGLTVHHWFAQLLFGLIGIDLGYMGYLILKPEPLVTEITHKELWLPSLILILFTGFLEELIFRGLMQHAFISKFGTKVGIFLVSILYALIHMGYQSLVFLFFMFCVGVLFAILRLLTKSILGVSIAHGLANVMLYLIFPLITS